MADWYVDTAGNGASDSNTGHGWGASAFLTVAHAATSMAAGDRLFINSIVNDTYSASGNLFFTFPGTPGTPNYVYSTTTAHTPPTNADLTAGATVTSTDGASTQIWQNCFYAWGINLNIAFNCLQGSTVAHNQKWENCAFAFTTANAGSISPGGNGSPTWTEWYNCSLTLDGDQNIQPGSFTWRKGSLLSAGSIIGQLFNYVGFVLVEGVDLSSMLSTKALVNANFSLNGSNITFKDCKMAANQVILNSTPNDNTGKAYVVRSGSSGNDYFQCSAWAALETRETTVTRNGGAANYSGQGFSKKIVTTSNCGIQPFNYDAMPMGIVNALTGSPRTVTIYGVWDSPYGANTPPNTNDIWVEVDYLGDSGDPLGSFINSGPNPLTPLSSNVSLSTDGSSWNGTGGFTNPTPFKMTVTLTAQQVGPLTVRIYAGKPSTTFYIDAQPYLS